MCGNMRYFVRKNAKVCCGNKNFHETSQGISTRQDVEFSHDVVVSQDVTFASVVTGFTHMRNLIAYMVT